MKFEWAVQELKVRLVILLVLRSDLKLCLQRRKREAVDIEGIIRVAGEKNSPKGKELMLL